MAFDTSSMFRFAKSIRFAFHADVLLLHQSGCDSGSFENLDGQAPTRGPLSSLYPPRDPELAPGLSKEVLERLS